jgi:hypothetical protein
VDGWLFRERIKHSVFNQEYTFEIRLFSRTWGWKRSWVIWVTNAWKKYLQIHSQNGFSDGPDIGVDHNNIFSENKLISGDEDITLSWRRQWLIHTPKRKLEPNITITLFLATVIYLWRVTVGENLSMSILATGSYFNLSSFWWWNFRNKKVREFIPFTVSNNHLD